MFDTRTQTSIVTAKFQPSKKDRRISGEAFSFGQQQDKKEEAMNKYEIRGGTRHSLTRRGHSALGLVITHTLSDERGIELSRDNTERLLRDA